MRYTALLLVLLCACGSDGNDGSQGQPGDPGPMGAQGAPGPPGVQGEPGPMGVMGAPGSQGQPGEPGPAGERGPRGEQGPEGAQGPAGPAGEGPTVEAVVQGLLESPAFTEALVEAIRGDEELLARITGPRGEQGLLGPQGERGEQGEPGVDGADGGSCSVFEEGGTATLACEDGSEVSFEVPGQPETGGVYRGTFFVTSPDDLDFILQFEEIEGDLTISGLNIHWPSLRRVHGQLNLAGSNSNLVLDNLESVGALRFTNARNTNLQSLRIVEGDFQASSSNIQMVNLDSLEFVGGDFTFSNTRVPACYVVSVVTSTEIVGARSSTSNRRDCTCEEVNGRTVATCPF